MMIPALGAYRVTLLRTLLRSIRVSHIRKTMIKRRLFANSMSLLRGLPEGNQRQTMLCSLRIKMSERDQYFDY